MRGRRREDEHENLERWLITYADLITLLLAFFIMMYTFSKQDAQKYQEVTEYLRAIFKGGSGVLNAGQGPNAAGAALLNALPKQSSEADVQKQLEEEVRSLMRDADQQNKISVFQDERGVVIRIMDRAFFDEGKADLKELAKNALKKIGPILRESNRQIRIEGHTDDVPINTFEFKSNWELSTRRATEVVRHLIEKYDFPAQDISASGYAEYRPVAPNDTAHNRALNRRIEIILLQSAKSDQGLTGPPDQGSAPTPAAQPAVAAPVRSAGPAAVPGAASAGPVFNTGKK